MDKLPRIALSVEKNNEHFEWVLVESTSDNAGFNQEMARSPHAFETCVKAVRAGTAALVVALGVSTPRQDAEGNPGGTGRGPQDPAA